MPSQASDTQAKPAWAMPASSTHATPPHTTPAMSSSRDLDDVEAGEKAMLIEAARHPKPIAQWPLLIFYLTEIITFLYRTLNGGGAL